MKFSFILCTINRNDEIIKSINSILNQTYQNFEIIIIDQNEHKNEQLENIDKRIIYKHVNFKGLSSARNEALKYATGDYCCIMDDDALYDSYNLEVANKLLMRNLYTVLSGIIVDRNTGVKWNKKMPDNELCITKNDVFFLASASLIINTEILKKYMFDENLGAGRRWGCGEETDLLLRLYRDGYEMFYTPEIKIYHPVTDKYNYDYRKAEKYNLGFGAFYKKNHLYLRFIKAVLRNLIAMIIYTVKFDKKNVKYYYICFKNKIKGFLEYREAV